MTDPGILGPWLRRFLEEHLVTERNLARNTQLSYRDTLVLLLPFIATLARRSVERLRVRDLGASRIRAFLLHLEQDRGCSPQTRNQRLAAIRAFARFVASHCPELVEWSAQIRAIPLKKAVPRPVAYLEKPEMDALLAAPDRSTPQGRREHALLLFLYNTGARVSEAVRLTVGDLQLAACGPLHALVTLRGKRGKLRQCPLWKRTAEQLAQLVAGRAADEAVFRNQRGRPLTRSGMLKLVKRCARKAAQRTPSLAAKSVSPHVVRHTTATHLLRAGVDINTIRAWLGHVRLDTTNIYAEIDLETKARAIASCEASTPAGNKPWRKDEGTMAFLRSL